MLTFYTKKGGHKLTVDPATISAILEHESQDEAAVFFEGTSELVASKQESATKAWLDALRNGEDPDMEYDSEQEDYELSERITAVERELRDHIAVTAPVAKPPAPVSTPTPVATPATQPGGTIG